MLFISAVLLSIFALSAPQPAKIHVEYRLRVDSADLSGFSVDMVVHNAPATFTLAAAAHPEYDDKYWRYLTDLRVTDATGHHGTVTRADSALWRVVTTAGMVTVHYRLALPPAPATPRAAWKPFLSPTGGLVGGPHSFLYVLGMEKAGALVRLEMPASWNAASGLHADNARTFFAPNMHDLMDSPIFVGKFSDWRFTEGGLPHRIVFWRAPNAVAFDTVAFAGAIERYVKQALQYWGSAPYKDYTFMYQDNAYGGLEHINSLALGVSTKDLAADPLSAMPEVAHEYFHTWNLMAITPVEYREIDYRTQPPVPSLWFSEGLTIFNADLLMRRAGFKMDSTRIGHLSSLVNRWVANPVHEKFSAEQVSNVAYNAPPGALGDYLPGVHLQGEVIGAMLDLQIRGATNGAKSVDDVMRLMYARFPHGKGYTNNDIEAAAAEVCSCNVKPLFDGHVRNAGTLDYNRYLGMIGLRATVTNVPATNPNGQPMADMRIRGFEPPDSSGLRLLVWDPRSIWVRAGLHTNDRVVSINGNPIRTWAEMRAVLGPLKMGDTVRFVVARPTGKFETAVTVAGFETTRTSIEERADATSQQKALREQWLRAN